MPILSWNQSALKSVWKRHFSPVPASKLVKSKKEEAAQDPWMRALLKEAIDLEEQMSMVLRKGRFLSSHFQPVEVLWWFHPHDICLFLVQPSGRNSKQRIPLTNVVELSWYPMRSTGNQGCLFILYRELDSIRTKHDPLLKMLFLPEFGSLQQFADVKLILAPETVRANWSSAETGAPLWMAKPYKTIRGSYMAWLITEKVVWIAVEGDVPALIQLSHLCDLSFDEEQQAVSLKFATFTDMSYSVDKHRIIVEKTQILHGFDGGQKAFKELSLLWRQQIQLLSIEYLFETDEDRRPDMMLAKFILEKSEQEDAAVQTRSVSASFESQLSQSLSTLKTHDDQLNTSTYSLKRADSMRRVMPRRRGQSVDLTSILSRSSIGTMVLPETKESQPSDPLKRVMFENNMDCVNSKGAMFSAVNIESGARSVPAPLTPPRRRHSTVSAATHNLRNSWTKSTCSSCSIPSDDIYRRSLSFNMSASASYLTRNAIACRSPTKRRNTTSIIMHRAKHINPHLVPPKYESVVRKIPGNYHVAIYDYPTKNPGELNFSQNDVLKIVQKDKSGWWYACRMVYHPRVTFHDDHPSHDAMIGWTSVAQGWVPSNFLKAL